ncbi:MAG TPA: alpha/beta fold hydrolase [Alphaproteobacteria bacterium]
MLERKAHTLDDGGGRRRLSYLEAGAGQDGVPVLCVHGMTRNARDFERLAPALARTRRVICVDLPGRGDSDRLADSTRYQIPTYAGDLLALLDALGIAEVDWVGTSLGGMIGMAVAGAEDSAVRGVIRRLVLNDIGPFIPKAALARIGEYVVRTWRFESLAHAEAHVRKAYAPFGLRSDSDWRRLTELSVQPDADGGLIQNYDPAIGDDMRERAPTDIDLWPAWDRIRCPVLVLRGADSDVLPAEVAAEMTRRGPGAELAAFAGIGHAPALLDDDQISVVAEWLARPA